MVYYYPLFSESASHKHPCDACDACDACDVFFVERHCSVENKSYYWCPGKSTEGAKDHRRGC